ncbi:MAG: endonuclease/exonuclease/phosphatase family protein [Phycisphaerae bacterium]|nr:endonuclease/exonuclease/phosphatase family protein [Phycisphaerae bacterium]
MLLQPLILGIGSVLCTLAGCDPARDAASCTQPAEAPDRLTVVTYNVLRCRGGLDRITELLRKQNADVIFLQEVGRGDAGGDDQAAWIAKSLGGMHVVSASTLRVPAKQHCDEAILSRFELCDGAAHSLELDGWVYAVRARIKAHGRKLHLLSVHTHSTSQLKMKHVIETSTTRMAEVTRLLEAVRGLEGDVIVAGDFNAASWMPEYFAITRVLTDFGLVNKDPKLTFPSHRPAVRIDYVFGLGAFTSRSYRVLKARLSDHRAVAARLERTPARDADERPATRRAEPPNRVRETSGSIRFWVPRAACPPVRSLRWAHGAMHTGRQAASATRPIWPGGSNGWTK